MPFYRRLGSVPRKRHINHPQTPGYRGEGIYYEEVVTTAGFGRAYSIVYHLRPPTRVRGIEPAAFTMPLTGDHFKLEPFDLPVLRHHHLKTGGMERLDDSIWLRV